MPPPRPPNKKSCFCSVALHVMLTVPKLGTLIIHFSKVRQEADDTDVQKETPLHYTPLFQYLLCFSLFSHGLPSWWPEAYGYAVIPPLLFPIWLPWKLVANLWLPEIWALSNIKIQPTFSFNFILPITDTNSQRMTYFALFISLPFLRYPMIQLSESWIRHWILLLTCIFSNWLQYSCCSLWWVTIQPSPPAFHRSLFKSRVPMKQGEANKSHFWHQLWSVSPPNVCFFLPQPLL